MADQRIQYAERMTGNGHPSLPDTLNRLTMVAHNSDGSHKGYKEVSQYANLQAAVAALAGTDTLLVVTDAQTLIASTVVTNPIYVAPGGSIEALSGTVTISAPFTAGLYECLGGAGSFVFSSGTIQEVYPEWWGAVADGVTDCLSACQKTAASIATIGGTLTLTSGTYLLSDSWNITSSNTYLQIKPGATLRCDSVTADGHTVAFIGTEGNQLENVGVYGGGTVRNTSSGSNENAIGFARCKYYSCVGMNILAANKKAITAQVDCDYGRILNNLIGTTGSHGISIEGDSLTPFTEENSVVVVSGNIVLDAGGAGINFDYANASSPKLETVHCSDNTVVESTAAGYNYSGVNRLMESNNVVLTAGTKGFSYLACASIRSTGATSKTSTEQGIYNINCGPSVNFIAPNIAGVAAGVDAIYTQSPTGDVVLVAPEVNGSLHRYSVNTASMGTAKVVITSPKLASGATGIYGSVSTIQANQTPRTQTLAFAATITPDFALGDYVLVGSLTNNITINPPINMLAGQSIKIRLVQDGTGGRTVTLGDTTNMKLNGSVGTTANRVNLIQFDYDGSKWRGWTIYTDQVI